MELLLPPAALLVALTLAPSVLAQEPITPSPLDAGVAPAPTPARTRFNSPAMLTTGAALGLVGAAELGFGLFFALYRQPCTDGDGDAFFDFDCDDTAKIQRTIGITATVGGGVMLAVGIPLIVAGAWRVEITDSDEGLPAVSVGPGTVDLGWRF